MTTCDMNNLSNVRELVAVVQGADDPVVMYDGEDECLVALRPALFERILFEGVRLNSGARTSMCL